MQSIYIRALHACAIILAVSTPANAALIDRGGGLIYDTDRNITWLANANYAYTSGVDPIGWLSLDTAITWVANLNYGGYEDWRLPMTLLPDPSCSSGFNCVGSELGHLFYEELGGVATMPINFTHNSQYDLFYNLQTSGGYYWATPLQPGDPSRTWAFRFDLGYQGAEVIDGRHYWVLPVRDGDVAPVPVPAALWLFSGGLLALLGFPKKRRTH
jgi:hypothetical protein